MPFDRPTRNALARMVGKASRLLAADTADGLRRLGIQDDGALIPLSTLGGLSEEERAASAELRELLAHLIAQEASTEDARQAAYARLVREIGFTTFNRLVALRMAEERGLVQESVRNGLASAGFQLFEHVANSALGNRAQTYRIYLECLYDELAVDLPFLFSRAGPESRLFPAATTLEAVLGLLADPALAHLWAEDEAIGWVYQYYNDPDERKKMREAGAPRNSRELAVRNQFFTPRYVVEFLTDNTLGRIWYEMHQGNTGLADQCRYLVRRFDEVFLGEVDPGWLDPEHPDGAFLLGQTDEIAPFDLPTVRWLPEGPVQTDETMQLRYPHYGEAGERLVKFAHCVRAFPWPDDPRREGWMRLLADLSAGQPDDPVEGKTQDLWDCLLMIARAERFGDGAIAEHVLALTRIAIEIRRRVLRARDPDAGQEERLRAPFLVPFRAKQDPRDLKILDPACGSGHFLLYAFDLLETIYGEAWEDEQAPESEITGTRLRDDYAELDVLRRALPDLILRHNLHGVDIDPRAVQIAGLALWLRAQRTYQRLSLRAADRPPLRRGNLVVAEPMPGERDLLEQFVARLDPPLVGGLVKLVFDKMQLAGEAGTLLKIEEELRDAIHTAKFVWQRGPRAQQLALMPEFQHHRPEQLELDLDVSGITDEAFLEHVEQRVFDALEEFAADATDGIATQRRLFAEDARQGFALVDLSRKRFDAVLMNPPFGDATSALRDYLEDRYPSSRQDLSACFVERAVAQVAPNGFTGVISTEANFFRRTLESWRGNVLLQHSTMSVFAHLGGHVLDGATVRTACYALETPRRSGESTFLRLVGRPDREELLGRAVEGLRSGAASSLIYTVAQVEFKKLPYAVFGYWCSPELRDAFVMLPRLEGNVATVRVGLQTSDDPRFLRLRWEVPADRVGQGRTWVSFAKGGEYSPFHDDVHLVLKWAAEGAELISTGKGRPQNLEFFGRPGLTYPRRTNKRFAPRALPAGCAFADKGPAIVDVPGDSMALLAALNSRVVAYLLSLGLGTSEAEGGAGANSYEVGLVQRLPMPLSLIEDSELARMGRRSWEIRSEPDVRDETTARFVSPFHPGRPSSLQDMLTALLDRRRRLEDEYSVLQHSIDERVSSVYLLTDSDWRDIQEQVGPAHWVDPRAIADLTPTAFTAALFQYFVGIVFGRWNPTLAVDPAQSLVALGPLDTMPPQSPAAACTEIEPAAYRCREGILVDDPDHTDDVVRGVREALHLLWGGRAEAIEQEPCEILGMRDPRDYFRRPSLFFADHLKRYSKSNRKAPIYWPLSTASGSYTLWIYYHRLTSDTLYNAINRYVQPKMAEVSRELDELKARLQGATGREAVRLRETIEGQTAFLRELTALRDELLRVAALPYRPNLDDGVIVNAAPLHNLFRLPKWARDTRETWLKLERGDYDWAHLAYTIWPDRVREKCRSDRSLAIAHDLEHLYVAPPTPAKQRRGRRAAVLDGEDEG